MYIYIYIYIHTHTVYIYIYIYKYTHTHCIHTYIYIYIHIYEAREVRRKQDGDLSHRHGAQNRPKRVRRRRPRRRPRKNYASCWASSAGRDVERARSLSPSLSLSLFLSLSLSLSLWLPLSLSLSPSLPLSLSICTIQSAVTLYLYNKSIWKNGPSPWEIWTFKGRFDVKLSNGPEIRDPKNRKLAKRSRESRPQLGNETKRALESYRGLV